MNRLELTASVISIEPLRHTPAGVPVLEMRLQHASQLAEAGQTRRVSLELGALAMGEMANRLAGIKAGCRGDFTGFLAPARMGSERLVLHVRQFTQGTSPHIDES